MNAIQDEEAQFDIFDLQGKRVFTSAAQLQKGVNVIALDYGKLPSGEYIVKTKGSNPLVSKLVVIN
jgi:hypothetical protein